MAPRNPLARYAELTLLGAAVVVALYLLAHLVTFEYGRDQGSFAVIANMMLDGKTPYVEAWDVKPPGIFFLYAAAQTLFGTGMHSIRILEALAFLSLLPACVIFTRRHLGLTRPGILAWTLAVFAHVRLEFWNTAQPESFGAVAVVWALVLADWQAAGPDGSRRTRQLLAWFGAGFLYAAAGLLKPPLGAGVLVSLAFVAYRRWRAAGRRDLVRALAPPAAALGAGVLVPLLATVIFFGVTGALGTLIRTLFVWAPQYTGVDLKGDWVVGLSYFALVQWLVKFSTYTLLGVALLVTLPPLHRREREGALHVVGVTAILLAGVAAQAKFFGYHFGAALPLGGILAGWGLWKLWIRARTSVVWTLAVWALLFVLHDARVSAREIGNLFWERCSDRVEALQHPELRRDILDRLYSTSDMNAGRIREVAEWLAARTPENASIYVWGFEPLIYHLADREPASRYVFNTPQRVAWAQAEARSALLADLRRSRPAAIVIEHGDIFPNVTGNRQDSVEALRTFPELLTYFSTEYEPAHQLEGFTILKRRASAGQRRAGGGAEDLGRASAPGFPAVRR